jgi:putative glutamine amidotransferase
MFFMDGFIFASIVPRIGGVESPMKPLIGISCCTKVFGVFGMPNHAASDTYVRATCEVLGGVPVLLPACGEATDPAVLLERLDGLMLTGSRSNVEPALYGGSAHPDGVPEDRARDSATLPMIRGALRAGLPILAICRGLQEVNVALGGSLHQRIQDLPGRLDHSAPMQPARSIREGKAHSVKLTQGGWLARLLCRSEIAVNSLHNQGIDRLADGLKVEAVAPDGTIEAVTAPGAPGYMLAVQWHPEYDFRTDPVSRAILESFAAAVRDRIAVPKLAAD